MAPVLPSTAMTATARNGVRMMLSLRVGVFTPYAGTDEFVNSALHAPAGQRRAALHPRLIAYRRWRPRMRLPGLVAVEAGWMERWVWERSGPAVGRDQIGRLAQFGLVGRILLAQRVVLGLQLLALGGLLGLRLQRGDLLGLRAGLFGLLLRDLGRLPGLLGAGVLRGLVDGKALAIERVEAVGLGPGLGKLVLAQAQV